MVNKGETNALMEALRSLLLEGEASTQEDICAALQKSGYEVNQSKVSRLLRKIGAIKAGNTRGQTTYSLPREAPPPTMHTPLRNLILEVASNEVMVVIFTSPGSASMVARILDYSQISTEVLGTVAGDDTIFVTPKSIKNIKKLHNEINGLLTTVTERT